MPSEMSRIRDCWAAWEGWMCPSRCGLVRSWTVESHAAADQADAGQRCEMSFFWGKVFNSNHAVKAVGSNLFVSHWKKSPPWFVVSQWGLEQVIRSSNVLACRLLCCRHVMKLYFNTARIQLQQGLILILRDVAAKQNKPWRNLKHFMVVLILWLLVKMHTGLGHDLGYQCSCLCSIQLRLGNSFHLIPFQKYVSNK